MNTIKVKNKTKWFVTIIFGFGLLLASFIIFFLIPLTSFKEDSFLLSFFNYIFSCLPFAAFFILILYLWLWNTFGKTILQFNDEKITVIKKYKLFSKPRTYYRKDITIEVVDFKIEKTKYNTRYHIFSTATFSLVFVQNSLMIRIIDWQSFEKAQEIIQAIQ